MRERFGEQLARAGRASDKQARFVKSNVDRETLVETRRLLFVPTASGVVRADARTVPAAHYIVLVPSRLIHGYKPLLECYRVEDDDAQSFESDAFIRQTITVLEEFRVARKPVVQCAIRLPNVDGRNVRRLHSFQQVNPACCPVLLSDLRIDFGLIEWRPRRRSEASDELIHEGISYRKGKLGKGHVSNQSA